MAFIFPQSISPTVIGLIAAVVGLLGTLLTVGSGVLIQWLINRSKSRTESGTATLEGRKIEIAGQESFIRSLMEMLREIQNRLDAVEKRNGELINRNALLEAKQVSQQLQIEQLLKQNEILNAQALLTQSTLVTAQELLRNIEGEQSRAHSAALTSSKQTSASDVTDRKT